MKKRDQNERAQSQFAMARRSFLLRTGLGLGSLSLAQLFGGSKLLRGAASASAAAPALNHGVLGTGHLPARAKRVIHIHHLGAVSQVDTFEYKPMLIKMHGQELPASVRGTARLSGMVAGQTSFPIVKPLAPFHQAGQSGTWVSDLFPYTRKIVDDLCFVHTVYTEHVNHDPAQKFLHTGFQLTGRPSTGAWVNYALGSDNANMPAFIVLTSIGTPAGQAFDSATWGSGFLPSHFQGVQFRSGADPVLYVNDPDGVDMGARRNMLNVIEKLSKVQYDASKDPEILSKLTQYEMSYRMQSSVPEIADLSKEPDHILDMYGPDVKVPGSFARNCLLARRLAERDVKFIQMINIGWDHHSNISQLHPLDCMKVDQPTAALITDLKQRGLLEDTLVVWGSEFGRTSFAQGALTENFGRDHHGGNTTYLMAGGGVKPGFHYGETDDFSYNVVKDPVHIHDLHATMLYLLGVDHEQLKFHYQGRDFRLTDVYGKVAKGIVA
jgi:hypothetical protein